MAPVTWKFGKEQLCSLRSSSSFSFNNFIQTTKSYPRELTHNGLLTFCSSGDNDEVFSRLKWVLCFVNVVLFNRKFFGFANNVESCVQWLLIRPVNYCGTMRMKRDDISIEIFSCSYLWLHRIKMALMVLPLFETSNTIINEHTCLVLGEKIFSSQQWHPADFYLFNVNKKQQRYWCWLLQKNSKICHVFMSFVIRHCVVSTEKSPKKFIVVQRLLGFYGSDIYY